MKLRSITWFFQPQLPIQARQLEAMGELNQAARHAFEQGGYEVQTTRLATTPFPSWLPSLQPEHASTLAISLEQAAKASGFDYLSLGPALPQHPQSYLLIPELLAATQDTFFSGMVTTGSSGISLAAVRACAEVIQRAAAISADGFTNLRFACLANVSAGTPFFPAAYHDSAEPAFALATEAADLAVQAVQGAPTLEAARSRLVEYLEENARQLATIANRLAAEHQTRFAGIDFSLAPFPQEALSLGTAIENLGVPAIGLHGSLAAAALMAEAVDRAHFPKAGFNGLMFPVLEDARLAQRAAQGALGVKDLLLYAAVCGAGLDTLPLPGDTTVGQLAALLLDIAALAQRLNKPLTARLMPIPGKAAGDPTDFDFAFFANSRVLSLQAEPLSALLSGAEVFFIQERRGSG